MSQINPSSPSNKPQQAIVHPPGQAYIVNDPNKRTAAFGIHMASALSSALTAQNTQIKYEYAAQKQVTIIKSIAQGLAQGNQGLQTVQGAIENLQTAYAGSGMTQVNEWLNIQAKSVQTLIDAAQPAYNDYQNAMNSFNSFVNDNWGELGRHSSFQQNFSYEQYVTYMSGQGDPTCTVPGSYYGKTVSYEMNANSFNAPEHPTIANTSPGLIFNNNYHENNKKSVPKYNNAMNFYGIWKGQLNTGYKSFSQAMTKQGNALKHEIEQFQMSEKTAAQRMKTMSTILSNLTSGS